MALDAQSQSLISSAQVKLGLRHSVVAAVRDLLYKANVPAIYSPADPFLFDAGLRDQVLAFQKGHGLGQDGIVGPKTWNALTGMAPDMSVVQVAPGGGAPGVPAPGNLGAMSILLIAAGGWLIYRWFSQRGAGAMGDYEGAPEVGAIVKAESDARIGNCHRARRRLRLIQPNVMAPGEQEMFRKAVRVFKKHCPESASEIEEREALIEQMQPRQQLKQGRPVRLEEDALRREFLDLKSQVAETDEYIEALKARGDRMQPAEQKELVRLETDKAALKMLLDDKREALRTLRKRIDQESGLRKIGAGRPGSRVIARIYKTGRKQARSRPSVVEVAATPSYVERETAEQRHPLYRTNAPQTPAEARARAWIESRLNRQPTRALTQEGVRRVATVSVRRSRMATEVEFEHRYKAKGFKLPKPRGPYKKKPKE